MFITDVNKENQRLDYIMVHVTFYLMDDHYFPNIFHRTSRFQLFRKDEGIKDNRLIKVKMP